MRRVVVAVISVMLVTAACGGEASPAEVLADFEEARNSGDIDAVMALYTEDAVVENHPAADNGISTGVAEIRVLELSALRIQGSTGSIEFIDSVVSGNTVTFKERFHNPAGECFSGGGNEVTVEDGKITRFVWGDEEAPNLCG